MPNGNTYPRLRDSVAYYVATKGYQIPPPNATIYALARAQGNGHHTFLPSDYARTTIGYQTSPYMEWVERLLSGTTE